jgi:methanogenic corrinoid protein MtbC1
MDGARPQGIRPQCRESESDGGPDLNAGGIRLSARGPDPAKQRFARIAHTIEREIVPRLVLAHRAAPGLAHSPGRAGLTADAEQVARFAHLVLERDVGEALASIEEQRARGVSLESVYLDLLAPAARHLGELWEADLCDFTQVTIGLWRLQQIVRELSPAFQTEGEQREHDRRVLLMPVRGEQHTFGLLMVADFFRRSGWDVWAGTPASLDELIAIVRSEWFAVVGFSVGCETHVEGLASDIHALRRASRNRGVRIMVGGKVFLEHPELAALVGADATACDARQACAQAESLLAMLAPRAF